jgi:hypothetical protein
MKTKYTIFYPDGTEVSVDVDWPENPGYRQICALVRPLLNDAEMEHVTVLHKGKRADMFVDEMGSIRALPACEKATEIYRSAWLARHPDAFPGDLAAIYGVAVLFHRIVWQ